VEESVPIDRQHDAIHRAADASRRHHLRDHQQPAGDADHTVLVVTPHEQRDRAQRLVEREPAEAHDAAAHEILVRLRGRHHEPAVGEGLEPHRQDVEPERGGVPRPG
jgi:hypothetical protein